MALAILNYFFSPKPQVFFDGQQIRAKFLQPQVTAWAPNFDRWSNTQDYVDLGYCHLLRTEYIDDFLRELKDWTSDAGMQTMFSLHIRASDFSNWENLNIDWEPAFRFKHIDVVFDSEDENNSMIKELKKVCDTVRVFRCARFGDGSHSNVSYFNLKSLDVDHVARICLEHPGKDLKVTDDGMLTTIKRYKLSSLGARRVTKNLAILLSIIGALGISILGTASFFAYKRFAK